MSHQFISDTELGDLPEALHLRAITDALPDRARARQLTWYTSAETVPLNGGKLRYRGKGIHADEGWYADEKTMWSAYLRRDNDGEVHLHIAAAAEDVADTAEQWFRAELPEVEHDTDGPVVPVTFWSLSSNGPVSRRRRLEVPGWEAISGNYPEDIRGQMADLLSAGSEIAGGGKLILWHGDPGTGKTWGLRALASEWRDWCDLQYITDPETFFGASSSYMLSVLLADEDGDPDVDFDFEDEDGKASAKDNRWRLLVMEDTGELLSADAKERVGQGLSRLLNTVDGLIGQGLRIMVLITTNEEVKDLHPAVRRPGRCASLIKFAPFGADEANDWLEEHGYDGTDEVSSAATVADLYAKLNGLEAVGDEVAAVGFGF